MGKRIHPADGPDTDPRYRSLLQKAVRRGNLDLVYTVAARMQQLGPRGKLWLRDRAATLVIAECWPMGADLVLDKDSLSPVAVLAEAARCRSMRDAAGLAYLALALAGGHSVAFENTDAQRHLRILAEGIRRPADFWRWAGRQPLAEGNRLLMRHAFRRRRQSTARGRALLQAAAYLAIQTDRLPDPEPAPPDGRAFEYWMVFDRHTRQGRRVCRDTGRDLHLPPALLEWLIFYHAGSRAQADLPSPWWRRFCRWQFRRFKLAPDQVRLVWDPVRPLIEAGLFEEGHRLHGEVYTWKQAHMDRVKELETQVQRFLGHRRDAKGHQHLLQFARIDP